MSSCVGFEKSSIVFSIPHVLRITKAMWLYNSKYRAPHQSVGCYGAHVYLLILSSLLPPLSSSLYPPPPVSPLSPLLPRLSSVPLHSRCLRFCFASAPVGTRKKIAVSVDMNDIMSKIK